jgi:hypothetical protein
MLNGAVKRPRSCGARLQQLAGRGPGSGPNQPTDFSE